MELDWTSFEPSMRRPLERLLFDAHPMPPRQHETRALADALRPHLGEGLRWESEWHAIVTWVVDRGYEQVCQHWPGEYDPAYLGALTHLLVRGAYDEENVKEALSRERKKGAFRGQSQHNNDDPFELTLARSVTVRKGYAALASRLGQSRKIFGKPTNDHSRAVRTALTRGIFEVLRSGTLLDELHERFALPAPDEAADLEMGQAGPNANNGQRVGPGAPKSETADGLQSAPSAEPPAVSGLAVSDEDQHRKTVSVATTEDATAGDARRPETTSSELVRSSGHTLLLAKTAVRVLIVPIAIATALVTGAALTIAVIPPASTEASGGTGIVADAGPSIPTEIHTFVPGSSYDLELEERPAKELSDADCWERSFVSARVDAILCALGGSYAGIIVDPCFWVDEEVAVCLTERDPFDRGDTPGILVRVASQVTPPSFVPADGLVGAEQASDTRYPLSFSIDRLADDGSRYLCKPMLSKAVSFLDVTFSCGTEPGTYAAISNGTERFAEGKWIVMTGPGAIRATSLDMGGETWTVQVADPVTNELITIDVLEAWF